MAGIYIHIPFCKQACHYCDFHFSTQLKNREMMVKAINKELEIRKNECNEKVETIYFGGGTPSVLANNSFEEIFNTIFKNYSVGNNAEITIEANPDDLNDEKFSFYKNIGINRLSIGIQSFFEEDLQWMNRAHNAHQAKTMLGLAKHYFDNISIDLIYGMPNMNLEKWEKNIATALSFDVPHISSYALTVEPKTVLNHMVKKQKIAMPNDALVHQHFETLVNTLENHGFIHYELSNFGKPDFFSKNNTAYWLGKSYLGIGPSAHSFDGKMRSWNVANNHQYINALVNNQRDFESENLSINDRYNEYIMTGLRTIWGVSISKIQMDFGIIYAEYFLQASKKYLDSHHLKLENDCVTTTLSGKFLIDGITANLFYIQ